MAYTGDTQVTPKLLEELTGTDLLVLNVPYPGESGTGMNLDVNAAVQIISHVKPKMAILTHFGLQMLKADPIMQAREIQRITGIQTIAAHDGLAISPGASPNHSPVKGFD